METLDIVICAAFAYIFFCPMLVCLFCIDDWKKIFEKILNFFSAVFAVALTVFGFGSSIFIFCAVFYLLFLQEPAQPKEPSVNYYEYQYQTEEPDPYWYDEYGFRYVLVYGSTVEYCLDISYEEELETPDSSAFTAIGYHPYHQTLWVVFRNTGAGYHYYDVPHEVWYEFKTADSKGSYFQECIRGYYEYDRD